MSDLEPLVSKNEEHLSSLISEVMKNGFANFLDRIKDDDYPETFKSDDISTLEKLESKFKKAKEGLNSRIDKEKKDFWMLRLCLFVAMILIIFVINAIMNENSNDYFLGGTDFLPRIVLIVEAVFLIVLFIVTIFEEIIYQIANWRRRRNTKSKVSLEDGDEKNEPIETGMDCENLKNRCQKLVEDLNENYEPMRNRYERLRNHNVFYHFVSFFIIVLMGISAVLDTFLYSTEKTMKKMCTGFYQLAVLLGFAFIHPWKTISENKKLKF
ncbi:hypothetical protein B9Z55_027481 [Caenorhabditis nigoni]|uniref:Uncharacterized protein n=1 Tax=Caenorhabditis nigoni TaxID=1611254 RepID=A0A2G5SG65_9PELO|nr:hypothetical protein B9Z55_027481 [Caenorhabditis nigoni]